MTDVVHQPTPVRKTPYAYLVCFSSKTTFTHNLIRCLQQCRELGGVLEFYFTNTQTKVERLSEGLKRESSEGKGTRSSEVQGDIYLWKVP